MSPGGAGVVRGDGHRSRWLSSDGQKNAREVEWVFGVVFRAACDCALDALGTLLQRGGREAYSRAGSPIRGLRQLRLAPPRRPIDTDAMDLRWFPLVCLAASLCGCGDDAVGSDAGGTASGGSSSSGDPASTDGPIATTTGQAGTGSSGSVDSSGSGGGSTAADSSGGSGTAGDSSGTAGDSTSDDSSGGDMGMLDATLDNVEIVQNCMPIVASDPIIITTADVELSNPGEVEASATVVSVAYVDAGGVEVGTIDVTPEVLGPVDPGGNTNAMLQKVPDSLDPAAGCILTCNDNYTLRVELEVGGVVEAIEATAPAQCVF